MATFFSTPTNHNHNHSQRDLAGAGGGGGTTDMSFHHYAAYSDSAAAAAGGLMPFPATIVSEGHVVAQPHHGHGGGDDGRDEITGGAAEMGLQTQLLMASASAQHGLSLSLGTQGVPVSLYQYRQAQQAGMAAAAGSLLSPSTASRSAQSIYVQNSRFLRAARELLDEVVSVRDAIKRKQADKDNKNQQGNKESGGEGKQDGETSDDKAADEHDGHSAADLTPSERQDLQNKVSSLMALLDEVDRKYRQYRQQMQAVSSSFDAVAGVGAARPYTALALQTISRHFRSLRDAVGAQVQSLRRSLGEKQDASAPGGSGGLSRLRYIDQQLRQQRAMQQFGMMQQPQHAWRPQRGLPESAVSVLRAWLFEHFLHPYPKDSEKLMLARQTGLSRGQVSNWFINARVRLWKPMIEEMYKEEFGAEMVDSHSSSENNKAGNNNTDDAAPTAISSVAADDHDEFQSPSSTANLKHAHGHGHHHLVGAFKSEAIGAMDGVGQLSGLGVGAMGGPYGTTSLNLGAVGNGGGGLQEALAAHHHQQQHHHGHGHGGDARFVQAAAYGDMAVGLGGYGGGGSVSLTLGLQHCNDGGGGAVVPAEHQQGLLYGSAAGDFEFISGSGEDRQRFSSSQLLHDFVA